jgi:2'-5' RNA ligase
MITNPTSHFIGVSLDSSLFASLFDKLSWYIHEYHLEESIELQRCESIHITLYYLPSSLSDSDTMHSHDFLNSIAKDIEFWISDIGYFSREGSLYILYLLPSNIEYFQSQNMDLASMFAHGDIEDNQYLYTPHMTILRILDPDIFLIHRASIENMIRRSIELLSRELLRYSIDLYRVDSLVHPELQEPISIGDIFDK